MPGESLLYVHALPDAFVGRDLLKMPCPFSSLRLAPVSSDDAEGRWRSGSPSVSSVESQGQMDSQEMAPAWRVPIHRATWGPCISPQQPALRPEDSGHLGFCAQ